MTTKVNMCNTALSHLGAAPSVVSLDPPDGGAYAIHCGRMYPVALEYVLESHPWQFALRRTALVLSEEEPNDQWAYAYAVPSSMVRPYALLPDGAAKDTDGVEYVIEDDVIFTNAEAPVLLYVTSEISLGSMPPSVASAVSWRLAYLLSGAIMKADGATRDYLDKKAISEMMRAASIDAMSRKQREVDHTPSWISAR